MTLVPHQETTCFCGTPTVLLPAITAAGQTCWFTVCLRVDCRQARVLLPTETATEVSGVWGDEDAHHHFDNLAAAS
jgi:hypothetical protein